MLVTLEDCWNILFLTLYRHKSTATVRGKRFILNITAYKVTAKRFSGRLETNFNFTKALEKGENLRLSKWSCKKQKKTKQKTHEKNPTKALTNKGKCIKSHLLCREDCSLNYSHRNTVRWTCLKWGKHLWAIQCFQCQHCNTFCWPQGMFIHDMWLHYNI